MRKVPDHLGRGMIIRLATNDDLPAIQAELPHFLKELQPFGSLVACDDVNVNLLLFVVRQAIDRGDPVVVAERDGQIVGFCLWTQLDTPLRYDRKVLHGLGTFVVPAFRKQGISDLIRSLAEGIARDKGYESILGSVHPSNVAGVASLEGHGWKTVHCVVVKDLR